jgi:UDP-glucose 4-epimerase
LLTHNNHSKACWPERVVLLGGNGFIGSTIIRCLNEAGVETLSADLDLSLPSAGEQLASILKPSDSIVMLAAQKLGRKHDEAAFVANVAMASNLCHAVGAKGCAQIVYISSDSVYPFGSGAISEATAPSATSLYALMHLARESLLSRIKNAPVTILRLTQVYGRGDPHDAYGPNRMVRSAVREGRIVIFDSGEETRDHIHVVDVARLVAKVIEFRSEGLINVATGRPISFFSLAQIIQDICGGKVSIEREPRRVPIFHRRFDISELLTAFPEHDFVTLEAGIRAMVEEERRDPHPEPEPRVVEGRSGSRAAAHPGDEAGVFSSSISAAPRVRTK